MSQKRCRERGGSAESSTSRLPLGEHGQEHGEVDGTGSVGQHLIQLLLGSDAAQFVEGGAQIVLADDTVLVAVHQDEALLVFRHLTLAEHGEDIAARALGLLLRARRGLGGRLLQIAMRVRVSVEDVIERGSTGRLGDWVGGGFVPRGQGRERLRRPERALPRQRAPPPSSSSSSSSQRQPTDSNENGVENKQAIGSYLFLDRVASFGARAGATLATRRRRHRNPPQWNPPGPFALNANHRRVRWDEAERESAKQTARTSATETEGDPNPSGSAGQARAVSPLCCVGGVALITRSRTRGTGRRECSAAGFYTRSPPSPPERRVPRPAPPIHRSAPSSSTLRKLRIQPRTHRPIVDPPSPRQKRLI